MRARRGRALSASGFMLLMAACDGLIAPSGKSITDGGSASDSALATPTRDGAATGDEDDAMIPPPRPQSIDSGAPLPSADAGRDVDDGGSEITDAQVDASPFDSGLSSADLPSTAACLTGGNVFAVDGDQGCYWLVGPQTDGPDSDFVGVSQAYTADVDGVSLAITPVENENFRGATWHVSLNTFLARAPIQIGVVYGDAAWDRSLAFTYAAPCNAATGIFRIDELSADPKDGGQGALHALTAAFSVTCKGSTGALRGCVHFEQP